jgi:hypothetical protein
LNCKGNGASIRRTVPGHGFWKSERRKNQRDQLAARSSLAAFENLHNSGHNRNLFDDLVGAQQNRWGYGKAERLGGLTVHGQLGGGGH